MEGKLATEPVEGYYFDQLEIGQIFTTPRVTVTEDAIIRFALVKRYLQAPAILVVEA